jgi:hypothetical protein
MIGKDSIISRYQQKQKLTLTLTDIICPLPVITELGFFEAPLQGSVGMVEICATKRKKERERAEITWELLNRIGK